MMIAIAFQSLSRTPLLADAGSIPAVSTKYSFKINDLQIVDCHLLGWFGAA